MASTDHLDALTPLSVEQFPPDLAGGVIAIGNFDGVHRGHVALLQAARAEARTRRKPSLVLTFEPHPRTVFRPEAPVFRLTPLGAKARLLKAVGIDGLAVATFDRALASLTPDEFIGRVLVGQLRIAGAVVGFNFRFGRARTGSPETLVAAGQRLGFQVTVVDAVADGGTLVASSDIRTALAAGDIARANDLLGYRWFVMGTVERGEARGRSLGFPTANLSPPAGCALRYGVYAVRLQRPGGAIHDGVASYGIRPTFGGGAPVLEVHLFDFNASLYGQEVAAYFVGWIREEAKFSAVAELVAAVRRDAAAARQLLARAPPGTSLDQRLAALP
jgi:riboflavin kinase/FMN adenylyltransferase